MRRESFAWCAAASLTMSLVGSLAIVPAQSQPYLSFRVIPLADCARLPARSVSQITETKARISVLEARRCRIDPGLIVSVINDLSESPRAWPIVEMAGRPRQSLENALTLSIWFENTRPLRVRFARDQLIIANNRTAAGFIMTGYASKTLDEGEVKAFVAVRLWPNVCLVSVRPDLKSAAASLRAPQIPCLPDRAS